MYETNNLIKIKTGQKRLKNHQNQSDFAIILTSTVHSSVETMINVVLSLTVHNNNSEAINPMQISHPQPDRSSQTTSHHNLQICSIRPLQCCSHRECLQQDQGVKCGETLCVSPGDLDFVSEDRGLRIQKNFELG